MWQLINLSTIHSTPIVGFGVPIFSDNGKTLIRLPLGVALKCKAHDISVFRVEKRCVQNKCIVGTVSCRSLLLSLLNLHCKCIVTLC